MTNITWQQFTGLGTGYIYKDAKIGIFKLQFIGNEEYELSLDGKNLDCDYFTNLIEASDAVEQYIKDIEMTNQTQEKEVLQDLIIRADQLQQISLENNNSNFKRVAIFNHLIALKVLKTNSVTGITLPFSEINLDFGSVEQEELQEVFEQAGYSVSVQCNSGYGHYFGIIKR